MDIIGISISILLVIVEKSTGACDYSTADKNLICKDVAFSELVQMYSNIKTNVVIANIQKCDKTTIGENEIPFVNLQELHLSCNIESLKSQSFSNLKNLRRLNLDANKISTIPNDLYQELQSLETLQLSHNLLRNPTIDSLYYLDNLKHLDMSHNRISNIDTGVMDRLKSLKMLNLSHNAIFLLVVGVFDELTNLTVLNLSYNDLNEISLGLFDQSSNLIEINLEGNRLSQIPLGALDRLVKLQKLNLSKNKLATLPLGLFDRTLKLNTLSLRNNDLKDLPVGLFDEIEHLVTANLSNCNLNKISNGLFDKNKVLINLDLSYNNLVTLDDGTLDDTKRLKFLNLSHNNVNHLPVHLFQQSELEVIDVSYNLLETIQPDLLNMENLREVHARNNNIEYLDSTTFATNGNPLKYIDMSFNRLVFIENDFFDWVANLERFDISGNPWDCKCLDNLLSMFNARFVSFKLDDHFEGKKPVCVVANPIHCVIDKTNLKPYYETYINS